MSERGSFVTEYIYCDKCLQAVSKVLIAERNDLCSTLIPTWQFGAGPLPIIAGKIGGSYPGQEIHQMELYSAQIERHICHQVRVAVLADNGESQIFTMKPIAQN